MSPILLFFSLTLGISVADVSPNYYCADMNPQTHINIEQTSIILVSPLQFGSVFLEHSEHYVATPLESRVYKYRAEGELMGMWYGIEILAHDKPGHHYRRVVPSCPILHLSEYKPPPPSTLSPLYRNYDYRYNYGERRDYDRGRNDRFPTTQSPYGRNYQTRRYGQKHNGDMKRLRIWWDENGSGTEYLLRYNVSKPGFWISSGPQNGSELEPLYSNFAGTIQVIKAVGNHLVLTFCHQLPDRQLFTIILGREHTLDSGDVYGVHSLLNRRGLSTSAVKKVCSNHGSRSELWLGFAALVLVYFKL